MKAPWRYVAFLALVPPLIILLALDYAASYLSPPPPIPRALPRVAYEEFDSYQMWRLRPGYRDAWVRISADGFREGPAQIAPGAVFVLGGSTVFGLWAPPEQTITWYLQRLADRLAPERKLRFINAGVTAYHSTLELIHLERNILRHEPSLVIAVTGQNDAYYGLNPQYKRDQIPYLVGLREAMGALDPYDVPGVATRGGPHLLRLFSNHLFRGAREFDQPELRYHPEATEVFLRNQRTMHEMLGDRYALFLQPLVNWPLRTPAPEEAGKEKTPLALAAQRAYQALSAEAVRSLDASWNRGLIDLSGEPGHLFIDHVHLAGGGARLTAQFIFRRLWGDWQVSRIRFDTDQDAALLGAGWHDVEGGGCWTARTAAVRLHCPANPVSAHLVIGGENGLRRGPLRISVNGRLASSTTLEARQNIRLDIPLSRDECAKPLQVQIESPNAVSPKEIGAGADIRRLGIFVRQLAIESQTF